MARRRNRTAWPFLSELALASWETIAWRSWMIAAGTCSAAEYQRMVAEKMLAAQQSALLAAAAAWTPWKRTAAANARRLRRRHLR